MTNAAAALSSPTSLYVRKALLDLNEKRAAVHGARGMLEVLGVISPGVRGVLLICIIDLSRDKSEF